MRHGEAVRSAGAAVTLLALMLVGCQTLGLRDVIRPPEFEEAGRGAEFRLLPPSAGDPFGGAAVRLWIRAGNPNPVGLTLAHLAGTLFLEDTRAAEVDLPLGLPLQARQDTVIPVDLNISFDDLPDLANAVVGAVGGGAIPYRLRGTVSVDAGPLGRQTFGPSDLVEGRVQVAR